MRHECIDFLKTHPFLYSAFHPHKSDTVLVFKKLAHRTHAAVAQVIDIIDNTLSVLERQKCLGCEKNIFFSERSELDRRIDTQAQI